LGGGNSDSITFHNRSSTKGRGIPSSLGSMGIPLSVESIFHFVRRSYTNSPSPSGRGMG
jgi:hypothetical protein